MHSPRAIRRLEVMDDDVAAMLRQKSSVECVAMVCDANETARVLAAAGARCLHPDWSDDQVLAEVARRMLGDSA